MLAVHFDSIDSTSDEARRRLLNAPAQRVLVSAATQTAGRGRGGRTWVSPVGGAWFTLGCPCCHRPEHYPALSLAVGAAVLQTIEPLLPGGRCALRIKWPNDVLLDGQKVAGILCEMHASNPPGPSAVIVGVGVNVNLDPELLGEGLRYPATSLRRVLGRDVDLPEFIGACAARIATAFDDYEAHGLVDATLRAVNTHLAWRDETVTLQSVADPTDRVTGVCRGVDTSGRLRIETAGRVQAFDTGEVAR